MPCRVPRRWSTRLTPSESQRLLVLNSRSSLSQTFRDARRVSSTASAGALLRQTEHASKLHHNAQRKFPATRNKKREKEEDARKQAVPLIPAPDDLLQWLDEHFALANAAGTARQHINSRQHWLQFLTDSVSVRLVAEELAQTETPRRALYVLQAAHSIGAALKQNVYECVVFRLQMAKEWYLARSVIEMALATGKVSARLLNWQGRALFEVQDFARLDRLFEDFAKYGIKPQRRTFILVLQGHLRNHDLTRARATIIAMEDAGFPVTASTYMTIVPAYRGFGLDGFIEGRGYDILSHNQDLPHKERILNGLLRLHLDAHDLDGALQLLESSSSLSRSLENSAENAENVANSSDVPPPSALEDVATYTMLIDYLSKHGPHSLNGVFTRMKKCGCEPDVKVAAALIRMHYLRGEEHDALTVLRDCCRDQDLDMDTMSSLGYDPQRSSNSPFAPFSGPPTSELFNCVMNGALGIHGMGAAIPVLKLMKNAHVKPNAKTLETFLWHLAKERLILTEDLVDVMRSLLSPQIRPTLGALNILLKSIVHSAKRSRHKEGWNALATYTRNAIKSLKQSGSIWTPHPEKLRREPTFDPELCITDLQSSVFHDVLQPIVRFLCRHRVLADRATFSLRMRYDNFTLHPTQAPEAVARNLQTMRDRGLHPNVYHYAALMEAYCASGNIRAAHEVLQTTKSSGLVVQQKSHAILYTILISANSRIGRPDLALSIFKEMLDANVAPDVASVDALVGAFFAVKAFKLARRVLLDLWPMVAPFPMEMREASLLDLITRLRELRDSSESPNRDIKRWSALDRNELMTLSNEIVAEWKEVSQVKRRKSCGPEIGEMESVRKEDRMSNPNYSNVNLDDA